MARTARVKEMATGEARYHLIARTNDKRFLFERADVKDALTDAIRRSAVFSGIALDTYTTMDNHLHILCVVTRTDTPVPEEELLRRVGVLKGVKAQEDLAEHWRELHAGGFTARLEEEQTRLRMRMNDISAFMKTLKETFDRWYKKRNPYVGSIWSGRFTSTLVEGREYFARCRKYILYNAVRAGIVSQAKDYRWNWCKIEETGDKILETEVCEGSVPTEESGSWWLKRMPQLSAGKVLGSGAYVRAKAFELGDRFRARSVGAHAIESGKNLAVLGFSSHGWRLAKEVA